MIVRSLAEIVGTDRDVRAATFASRRMLLQKDGMGFSLNDTVLYAGTVTEMRYENHLEAVYCLGGLAEDAEELVEHARSDVREVCSTEVPLAPSPLDEPSEFFEEAHSSTVHSNRCRAAA